MKHLLSISILSALIFFISCENLNDNNPGGEDGQMLPTISEQVEAIKSSLPKLRKTLKSLQSFIAEDDETKATAIAKSSENGNINNIKEYILALEERIETLEEQVYGEYNSEWLKTTYATIDMYNETVSTLALIQCEIDSLKGSLEQTKEELRTQIETNITDCVSSMKSWVSELLTGYYDIATTDAMFAKLYESMTAEDEATREELEKVRSNIDEQMAEMENGYKAAIKEAIEKNNGILTTKLEEEINKINTRIDEEIKGINQSIKDIEDRLSKLEGSVDALIKRIQSISYIPIYDDANARVVFPNENTSGGTLSMDFKITPANAVQDLVKASGEIITVQAMYTGSTSQVDLPVTGCTADAEQGVLTVICACDNLSMDFYNGEVVTRAIMHISDGNNDKNSEYVPLTPTLAHIPDNQIWYTVTGKVPIEMRSESGPKVISNVFDPVKKCYIVTFEKTLTSIPASFLENNNDLLTITTPNKVTTVGDRAFQGCSNLSHVTLGKSLSEIGSNAFLNCNLSDVTLPESIRTLGINSFDYNKITSISGKGVSEDGISIVLSKTLKGVIKKGINDGKYAIPEAATKIDEGVFAGYENIKELTIHKELTRIGESAFENCRLEKVNIEDLDAWYNIAFGNPTANPLNTGGRFYLNGEEIFEISFPSSLRAVPAHIFYGCNSLRSVTLHDKITKIGEMALYGCSNLNSIIFQMSTPPTIGEDAFNGCKDLKIYIPSDEKAIEAYLTCSWYDLYQDKIVWDLNDFPKTHIIEYTTSNGKTLNYDGENIHSNTYENGKGVITFKVPVTSFSGFASGQRNLTSCTLPEGIVSISDYAFNGCSSLREFDIPESVESIGQYAFDECSALKSITLPQNITRLDEGVFRNCSSLTEFNISERIESIDSYAFDGCSNLETVTFETKTPPHVSESAFGGCHKLKIIVPSNEASVKAYLENWSSEFMVKIPEYIFKDNLSNNYWFEYTTTDNQKISFNLDIRYNKYENGKGLAISRTPITEFRGVQSGQSNLLSCILPEGVVSISYNAFQGCTNLREFNIPESVESIGQHAFEGCSALKNITLPRVITRITAGTFQNCSSLTNILINKEITDIEDYAFNGCSNMETITFEAQTPPNIPNSALEGCNKLEIIIPANNEACVNYLESNLSDDFVKKISNLDYIPQENIIRYTTTDGKIADPTSYYDDYNINLVIHNTIDNGEGITTFRRGIKTFMGFESDKETILSCRLPNGVEKIGVLAFYNCTNLREINIPDSCMEIEASAFSGCTNLTEITIPNNCTKLGSQTFYNCDNLVKANILGSLEKIENSTFASCKNLTEITIPKSCVKIGDEAFFACTNLEEISIPENCTKLGRLAFCSCSNLVKVNILGKLEKIEENTFQDCHKLKEVNIPESCVEIGKSAFWNCFKLKTVTIPRNCTKLGEGAFGGAGLTSIELPDELSTIPKNAFRNCRITEITIPEACTTIGDEAFMYCALTKLEFAGNKLQKIGDGAFNSTPLTNITIPESCKSIGDSAFAGYTRETFTIKAINPPTLGDGVFENIQHIYVPTESVELYKNADQWKEFSDIISGIL